MKNEDVTPEAVTPKAEVVRHFLRLEASRQKYRHIKEKILSWCELPDQETFEKARHFADEREDVNPTLAYTVGTPKADFSERINFWKRERIKCSEVYTCGISPRMLPDIRGVAGNVRDFALGSAATFQEFNGCPPISGDAAIIIVVAQLKPGMKGVYELLDGAHRLIAICRAGAEEIEAYVGHIK